MLNSLVAKRIEQLAEGSKVRVYKKEEEPVGTLFIIGVIIVLLAILLTFSNADGLVEQSLRQLTL